MVLESTPLQTMRDWEWFVPDSVRAEIVRNSPDVLEQQASSFGDKPVALHCPLPI